MLLSFFMRVPCLEPQGIWICQHPVPSVNSVAQNGASTVSLVTMLSASVGTQLYPCAMEKGMDPGSSLEELGPEPH